MSFKVGPDCNECGACLLACPRGAIRLAPGCEPGVRVVSLDCNDCGKCAIVCPEWALTEDPDWAVCWGRGCPMSTGRYADWTCAEGRRRCTECGNSLWKPPDAAGWVCVRCDHGRRVLCPKVRRSQAQAT